MYIFVKNHSGFQMHLNGRCIDCVWCSFSSVDVNLLLVLLYYMYIHLNTIKCELWHTVYRLSSSTLISNFVCFNLINNFWGNKRTYSKACLLSLSLSLKPSSHQLQSSHLGWWIQQKHYACWSMSLALFHLFMGVFFFLVFGSAVHNS